jgi:hypothetical protein
MIFVLRFIIFRIGVFSVIFGVLISAYAGVSESDWRFYAKSEYGSYCYGIENLPRLSNHLIKVWQKLILNSKGITNLGKELGEEYENVSEIITLREIDCINKKIRILELIFRSEAGRVIKRESYNPFEWDSIIPDSVDDALCCAVCK